MTWTNLPKFNWEGIQELLHYIKTNLQAYWTSHGERTWLAVCENGIDVMRLSGSSYGGHIYHDTLHSREDICLLEVCQDILLKMSKQATRIQLLKDLLK